MSARVLSIFEAPDYQQLVQQGADAIIDGKIVVLPTETVYGAAGMLNHPSANTRLHAFRNVEQIKPLTIHLGRRDDAANYLGPMDELGKRLMQKLWPGPVGLSFEVPTQRRAQVASELKLSEAEIYDQGTVTLRFPDHSFTTDVISRVPGPVVLTMASPTGGSQGVKMESLAQELGDKVDLIFDSGPTRYSKPSTLLKVTAGKYEVVRSGVYDERIIERLLKTTILFVCSGNTCRSPMAEAIARNLIAKKLNVPENELEKKGINVISAGSFATPGARATPQGIEALKELNIDLSRHRSRTLSVELVHQADWIFVMGRAHAQAVVSLVPSAVEKVQLLNPQGDIDDPIGSSVDVYKGLAAQLQTFIQQQIDDKAIGA